MINDKEHEVIFAYRTITFYGIPFQGILANQTSSKCSPSDYSDVVFLQPPPPHLAVLDVWNFQFTNVQFSNKSQFFNFQTTINVIEN